MSEATDIARQAEQGFGPLVWFRLLPEPWLPMKSSTLGAPDRPWSPAHERLPHDFRPSQRVEWRRPLGQTPSDTVPSGAAGTVVWAGVGCVQVRTDLIYADCDLWDFHPRTLEWLRAMH